jgi:FtsP/CotA-like multicopper oxidase with cupredoxin domain
MDLSRRTFLQLAAGATLVGAAQPDYTLRIGKVNLEVAPGRFIKTTGFNGSAPGPLLRLKEGQPVTIQVINEFDRQDIVHWHGLHIPAPVDGAMEEGSPMVDGHASRLYSFTPAPSGTRWYHTHTMAGRDLNRATYTGEFGFLYIAQGGTRRI